MRTPSRVLCLLAAVTGSPAVRAAEPELSRAEVGRLAAGRTALVESSAGRLKGVGSAFCVHPDGFFVTNQHVVGAAAEVRLVVDSGRKTQRVLTAKVIRADKDKDLAVLRAEGLKGVDALALGSDENLGELTEVIACGFPFGTMLGSEPNEYPAASVNVGNVTALRRKGGQLYRIQVDVALNPGNSGGPVLDRSGKVVGVVVAGVLGSGVNFVIPVSHLAAFLNRPELEFHPPALTRASLGKPTVFRVRATLLLPGAKPPDLELVLDAGGGKERRFPMGREAHSYTAQAVPAPDAGGPPALRLTITYPGGSVSGATADRPLTVGGKPVRLADVGSLRLGPGPEATLADGRTLGGPVTGLDGLDIGLGTQAVKLDVSKAASVRVERPDAGAALEYRVVARQSGAEVARLEGRLVVADAVASTPRAAPATITPPVLQGEMVRPLPSPVAAVAVGGGGRYLVLHLRKLRKLAVFDVNEARVVNLLPLAEDNVAFAAGRDKLLVALPGSRTLERWSLTTFRREAAAAAPVTGEIVSAVMGADSEGPVLVNGDLVDLGTLKPLPVKYPNDRRLPFGPDARYRVSGDGTVFGVWSTNVSPSGIHTFVLTGNEVKEYYVHDSAGHVAPGPDGRVVYTGRGLRTAEVQPLGGDNPKEPHFCIPPAHGGFYLTVRMLENPEGPNDKREGVDVWLTGLGRRIARLPQVTLWEGLNGWGRETIGLDQRLYLIPDAKLILTLPPSNDRIVLYRFDPEAALASLDVDYLFVASRPPATARRGLEFVYQLVVRSKKGAVKYRVLSAPDGLTVSPTGEMRWRVPPEGLPGETDVVLVASDAGGQECYHSFKLRTVD